MQPKQPIPLVRAFWLIGTLLELVVNPARTSAEDWLQRLRSEAPKAWRQTDKVYSELEASYTFKVEYDFKEETQGRRVPPAESVVRDVLLSGTWARVIERQEGKESVHAVNSRYGFRLSRMKPGSGYVLTSLGKPSLVEGDILTKVKMPLKVANSLGPRPLLEWINTQGFEFTSASLTSKDGVELVRVEARYRPVSPPKFPEPPPLDAVLMLDPQRHWCLVYSKETGFMTTPSGTKTTYNIRTIDYGPDISGVPVPSRIIWQTLSESGSSSTKTVIFKSLQRRKAPESEFLLSAFGLPEPPGVGQNGPTPIWVWVASAALLFLAIAAALLWLKRRALRGTVQ